MTPIDNLLSRLDAKPNGSDRWRTACPCCGGSNRSTLSIGIGNDGAKVLLKCFKNGCSTDQIAQALGLEFSDLFPQRPDGPGAGSSPMKRRRMLSAGQALDVLNAESLVVYVIGSDMKAGRAPGEAAMQRLRDAVGRIQYIVDEVSA